MPSPEKWWGRFPPGKCKHVCVLSANTRFPGVESPEVRVRRAWEDRRAIRSPCWLCLYHVSPTSRALSPASRPRWRQTCVSVKAPSGVSSFICLTVVCVTPPHHGGRTNPFRKRFRLCPEARNTSKRKSAPQCPLACRGNRSVAHGVGIDGKAERVKQEAKPAQSDWRFVSEAPAGVGRQRPQAHPRPRWASEPPGPSASSRRRPGTTPRGQSWKLSGPTQTTLLGDSQHSPESPRRGQ